MEELKRQAFRWPGTSRWHLQETDEPNLIVPTFMKQRKYKLPSLTDISKVCPVCKCEKKVGMRYGELVSTAVRKYSEMSEKLTSGVMTQVKM